MVNLELTDLLWYAAPVIALGILGVAFAYLYNRLYRYSNAADANLGQIRVALKKRLDMIEQLLGAVRGYIQHEREVFERIAEMRARLFEGGTGEISEIERESRGITVSVMAVAEDYPELKANETVRKLMDAIVSVEDEIARHRYTFNNIVQEFNTMVDTIPSNLIARAVGHEKLEYLQFEEPLEAPEVKVTPGN